MLEETYGVIVYQEQVMQISNRLAGYSLGDAGSLAARDGKEKAGGDGEAARAFVEGAVAQGLIRKKSTRFST